MSRGPGASNRDAGLKYWQYPCARWLAAHGWPLAMSASRGADMVAGPVAVETTIAAWGQIWAKLRQAQVQAAAAGVPYGCVWRKRNREPGFTGSVDPGRGAVVMQADQFWGLVGRLEAAERAAEAAEADLRRWMERERVS